MTKTTIGTVWEIAKAVSVPIAVVLSGFIWQFHGDVSDLKATSRYLNTELAKNEGELKSLKQNLETIRIEFLKLKANSSKISERTKMLNANVDRITKVLIKDLTLIPPLRSKVPIDDPLDKIR